MKRIEKKLDDVYPKTGSESEDIKIEALTDSVH